MPALPNRVLFAKLRAALPADTAVQTAADQVHPAIVDIPTFGRIRIYLWTVTADHSAEGARPPGEFKIQLILPEQGRGNRGALVLTDMPTYLLGYSPDFGVFVAWEARLYDDFAFSANVQVREELLAEARNVGWAVAPPRTRRGTLEVRVAFTPGNMLHFLRASRRADDSELRGQWREAFFLHQTPNMRVERPPARRNALEGYLERERRRVVATRALRDARFGPQVKKQFNYSCAVCKLELEIVESAHIIPVQEPEGRDEIWNGVALCPNHHTLFDARSFVIRRDLSICVDNDTVEFLRESDRDEGISILTGFDRRLISRPNFWERDPELREQMCQAFERRAALSGLGG